jgi:hypothetical protein
LGNPVLVRTQRIAPVDAPECVKVKVGYIKVRLSYLTFEPKHMRSHMLKTSCGAKPPYIEDVCILMPRMKVFPSLQTYRAPFEHLQAAGILPKSTTLITQTIIDEDDDTLAYVIP